MPRSIGNRLPQTPMIFYIRAGSISRTNPTSSHLLYPPGRLFLERSPLERLPAMSQTYKDDVANIVSPTPRKPGTASLNDMPLTPPQSPPPAERSLDPADLHIPDNYVQHTIATVPALPPIQLKNIANEIQWISVLALTVTPCVAIWGAFTTTLKWQTAVFSVFWYFVTG